MTDHPALLRRLVAANRFMALGTADADGMPWVSPVWYATADCRTFYWASKPGARHSRNLAARPQVAIVIYDSHVPGTWQSVYMAGRAEQVGDDELDAALALYCARSLEQGFPEWTRADVVAPARHRLYRVIAAEHFLLGPKDERIEVIP